MQRKFGRALILFLLVLVLGYGISVAVREKPILVDLATAELAPMRVTVDEEGITQAQDVYTISATIAGHLDRVELAEGDIVQSGQTIASVHPLEPPFLDERTRAEFEAALAAAQAGVLMAEVEHQRSTTAMDLAKSNYERAERLATTETVSQSTADRLLSDLQLQIAQVESARANIELRKAELASAQARLIQPSTTSNNAAIDRCCANMISPIDGTVLKVFVKSEQAVSTGARIAEVGDLTKMEVKVDVLSSDAIQIEVGATVELSDWGGEESLSAVVSRIEPAAFTKVSALGIEEQRVNVMLALEDPPQALGHGFRILARLTVWETDEALQIPISALFRSGGEWAAYTLEADRALLRVLDIGQLNDTHAQVLSGLESGDQVIIYPSDQLSDGHKVQDRSD